MKRMVFWLVTVLFLFACVVAVAEDNPTIAFDTDSYSIPVGKNVNIKTIITPKSNLKLEWSSSNEGVATVNAKGQVKGISEGEAEITVKAVDSAEISATCKVTVVVPVKKINLSEKNFEMPVDMTWQMVATVEPENATNRKIEWSSSKESVATVDQDGVIRSKSIGNTKITAAATDGSNVKVTINLKVDQFEIVLESMDSSADKELYTTRYGGENIKVKTKNNCVNVEMNSYGSMITPTGMSFTTGYIITPKKPGVDVITFTYGGSSKQCRVFVSPKVQEEQEIEEKKKDIVGETADAVGENGQILFKGIPWGASYNEVVEALSEKDDTVKKAIVRDNAIWTQIEGNINVGAYKASKNGLSFTCDNISKDNLEECKDKCKFFKADCYFDLDISFDKLKQNIMDVFGLSEKDAKKSGDGYVWTVNDVTIELVPKPNNSQLTLSCKNLDDTSEDDERVDNNSADENVENESSSEVSETADGAVSSETKKDGAEDSVDNGASWVCPNCGEVLDSAFCPKCGAASPTPLPEATPTPTPEPTPVPTMAPINVDSEVKNVADEAYVLLYKDYQYTGKYTGAVLNGFPQGYGVFFTDKSFGGTWHYIGEWDKGVPVGEGGFYVGNGQQAIEDVRPGFEILSCSTMKGKGFVTVSFSLGKKGDADAIYKADLEYYLSKDGKTATSEIHQMTVDFETKVKGKQTFTTDREQVNYKDDLKGVCARVVKYYIADGTTVDLTSVNDFIFYPRK